MIMLQDLAKNHGKTMISDNVLPRQFFILLWFAPWSFFSFYIYFIINFSQGIAFWKIGSRKVFAVPNRLVEKHREQIRIDGEEEQEIEITLPPIKRRRTVFPTDSRGIQTQLEKLSEDIQKVKSEIKNFHDLAFRHKFSVSCLFTRIGGNFFVYYL